MQSDSAHASASGSQHLGSDARLEHYPYEQSNGYSEKEVRSCVVIYEFAKSRGCQLFSALAKLAKLVARDPALVVTLEAMPSPVTTLLVLSGQRNAVGFGTGGC